MRLKELRIKRNLSQYQVGKVVNRSGQTILNWENGIYDPSVDDLILLADSFDVSVDYLVERKEKKNEVNDLCNELYKVSKDEIIEFIKIYLNKINTKDK